MRLVVRPNVGGNRRADELLPEGQAACRRVRLTVGLGVTSHNHTAGSTSVTVACAYFARFNTTSAVPPPVEAGVLQASSSPVRVNGRFCSVPFQFGNVLVSMWKVMVLFVSSTVYLPK